MRYWGYCLTGAGIVGLCIALFLSNVNTTLTEEDHVYVELIDKEIALPFGNDYGNANYLEQISVISRVVSYVNRKSLSANRPLIPAGMEREPRDWFLSPSSICYDLTRVTEKILMSHGFVVRHVAIFSMEKYDSAIAAFLQRRVPSHAVLEVLTERGWLLADPSAGVIFTSKDLFPVRVSQVNSHIADAILNTKAHIIFSRSYLAVYGLYSRHGMFYPMFNSLPDVAWYDLIRYGCCSVTRNRVS